MNLNFAPKREDLDREVENCVNLSKLDTLDSFCNGCMNRRIEPSTRSSCMTCTIQAGKERIRRQAYSISAH